MRIKNEIPPFRSGISVYIILFIAAEIVAHLPVTWNFIKNAASVEVAGTMMSI
jgi:hypothetical protein